MCSAYHGKQDWRTNKRFKCLELPDSDISVLRLHTASAGTSGVDSIVSCVPLGLSINKYNAMNIAVFTRQVFPLDPQIVKLHVCPFSPC